LTAAANRAFCANGKGYLSFVLPQTNLSLGLLAIDGSLETQKDLPIALLFAQKLPQRSVDKGGILSVVHMLVGVDVLCSYPYRRSE
jgi:hypothetical protein